ncbi:hypothetical protein POM88_036830 [Heracleum sosnowskyi]|uniref:Ionotropic glutamate receptor C-terminal domain-containing protein n=1 Tax=Heracleum sosnowskyi TaxID=360622 RepID=A0AAD8HQS5_9APIA|nr:hypothetical protein POM88_036830 [Heracleum sosnowskyi]
MNIFSHFIFLIISLSCPLLDTQVLLANGSLISPVLEHERAGTISIWAMFGETSRSRREAKVAIEMVNYDFYLITNQCLFLHSQSRPGPAALEEKDLISSYGVKAILGAHKRDEASAIAEAASDEAHDHVPVFQSSGDSIPTTPTFPWFLQANQLKKQEHGVLVTPATLGSVYRFNQLAKKLNMTRDSYAWISTHSITYLFHSISPKNMSSLQDDTGTKTYFPENWQVFHNFTKRFRSNFRIIHPDQVHDEPGIFASQAGDPVLALYRKPNITNLFQRKSAADPSAELQIIKWEKNSAEVVELVNVTGKTHQIQCRIKEFGFSETLDVGALYLNSIEDSEENLLQAQLWYTERRQRILTNRSETIRVGVPAQLMFRQFVEVKTDPKTIVTSGDRVLRKVYQDSMEIADVNNDSNNLYLLNGEYDDWVYASGKFDAVVGDETILEERHKYEDFSLQHTSLWSLILVYAILILAITIYNGFIVWLIKIYHNPRFTLSADKLQGNLSRIVMVVGLFVALILTQNYNSILSSIPTAPRLAPATKDFAKLKFTGLSQPYTESGMKSIVPIRSRLPIQLWHPEKRRRILKSRLEPIRVGVPAHSMFQQFVKVETDPKTNVTSYDGFSLKVFEEAMKIADVNNDLTYKYYSFDGEYDDLVKQIALGKLDVVAGDVSISEERHKYADFTQAYTELGMVLVVPIRSRLPIQMWLFMNPFTTELWSLILAITIYNGFIVWLIERNDNPGFRSRTVWNQIETLFWPASTTLFTLSADKLHSILSRTVMVVWLFVALILTQSYTSILSSMLTAQRLAPATKDVATLKKMNATVGYCRESFLKSYMINALGFESANIKKYSSTNDYAKALKTGEIAGIFLEVPSAKVFLSQYCKSFIRTEKIFKVGGYGFAFKKNFPLLPDINKAILKISENGKLLELEERYLNSEKCVEPILFTNEDAGIGLESFAILFVLSGCTSTVALAIYVIRHIICSLNFTLDHNNLFERVSDFTKRLIKCIRPSSAIVINIENPGNPPDATYSEAMQPVSTTIDAKSLEDHLELPDTDNKASETSGTAISVAGMEAKVAIDMQKILMSTYGVKGILGAHKWDDASAIAEAASDKAHISLQKELNQLKKQKNIVFAIPATLGLGYRLHQLTKKLNNTGDGYVGIATQNVTDLLHSISPKKMSSLHDTIETKTYFQRLFKAKVVEFVKVTGKTIQSGYWMKGSGFSETIDVEALFLNSNEKSKEVLSPEEPCHTERRRHILTSRPVPIRVGLPSLSMFQNFVKVGTDPGTNVTSYDGFSLETFVGFSGDVTILGERQKNVVFSQPYTEWGKGQHNLTSRSQPLRVGVPSQSIFQEFVKVETDPKLM